MNEKSRDNRYRVQSALKEEMMRCFHVWKWKESLAKGIATILKLPIERVKTLGKSD